MMDMVLQTGGIMALTEDEQRKLNEIEAGLKAEFGYGYWHKLSKQMGRAPRRIRLFNSLRTRKWWQLLLVCLTFALVLVGFFFFGGWLVLSWMKSYFQGLALHSP